MGGDHIGVALAQHHGAGLRGVRASEVGREQVAPLVVHLAVGAVEVLGLLLVAHRAGAEAQDTPAAVAQRERDPPAEAGVDAAGTILRALHDPRVQELRLAEAAAP